MSPSDFERWQWLLVAAGAGSVAVISGVIGEKAKNKGATAIAALIMVVTAFAGLGAFVIAVIRFIKWAWNG